MSLKARQVIKHQNIANIKEKKCKNLLYKIEKNKLLKNMEETWIETLINM